MGRNIAFIDSGIGGLSIFNATRKILPNEDYIYYADNANMPYGQLNREQLQKIALKIIDTLLDNYDINMFVIACNTLTANAIDYLREVYPRMPFIGCEPNVKQALKENSGNTLVLMTPSSFACNRISDRLHCKRTIFMPIRELAILIEEEADDKIIINSLKKELSSIKESFSSVVLGCTHYSLKIDLLKDFFCLPVYDGVAGTARHIKELNAVNQSLVNSGYTSSSIILSRPDPAKYIRYANIVFNGKKI